MNKATKGALAAAASVAIVAGGAGTMAAWNASSSLGSGSVQAGTLNIQQQGTGSWHWGDATGPVFNPVTEFMVPGDSVVYVGDYKITAQGTNLRATLTPSVGGLGGDLAPYLEVTNVNGAAVNITPADNNTTKTIGTKVTFKSDATGVDGQGKTASLSGASVVLSQTVS